MANTKLYGLYEIPDKYITQELCDIFVHKDLDHFEDVPDKFKTKELCEYVMRVDDECDHISEIPKEMLTEEYINRGLFVNMTDTLPRITPDILTDDLFEKVMERAYMFPVEYVVTDAEGYPVTRWAYLWDVIGRDKYTEEFCIDNVLKNSSFVSRIPVDIYTYELFLKLVERGADPFSITTVALFRDDRVKDFIKTTISADNVRPAIIRGLVKPDDFDLDTWWKWLDQDISLFDYVPDKYKTYEICYRAVEKRCSYLQMIPDHIIREHDGALWKTTIKKYLGAIGYLPDNIIGLEECDEFIRNEIAEYIKENK